MLFAHTPAGFLAAYFTRKIWTKNLTQKQTYLLYFLGAIFGIFPDIDGLYFYLVSATLSHREYFTHSFIFYFLVWLILYFIARLAKNNFLKATSFVFFFATLSHLLLDSLSYGVMWFYPFSHLPFGLLSFDFLSFGFFGQRFLFINLFLETVIILAALNLFFFIFFKKYFKKILIASYLIFISVIFVLYISWPYLYRGKIDFYYKDQDKDKIINMRDLDLDGDGILNFKDKDADNNNQKNIDQISKIAEKIEGTWHDRSEGGFWEIPSRFGLLSKTDAVIIPYNAAGIFLKKELEEDFQKYPYRYANSPKNSRFIRDSYNLFIFFRNNGMLKDGGYFKAGDIVFFGEKINNIGLVINGGKEETVRILMADRDKFRFLSGKETQEKYGKIIGIARLKYK
ncbi:MAG: metal-dependent hydrolase [Patescibacteria group bacterium]